MTAVFWGYQLLSQILAFLKVTNKSTVVWAPACLILTACRTVVISVFRVFPASLFVPEVVSHGWFFLGVGRGPIHRKQSWTASSFITTVVCSNKNWHNTRNLFQYYNPIVLLPLPSCLTWSVTAWTAITVNPAICSLNHKLKCRSLSWPCCLSFASCLRLTVFKLRISSTPEGNVVRQPFTEC